MSTHIPDEVREYMSKLGKSKSPAKLKAQRRAAVLGGQARRKDPNTLPCTCGQCPDNPKTTCPRGMLLYQRARLARIAAEDKKDVADAERIIANSDPTQRKSLKDLKRARGK
jgi:hypothetical protein